MIEKLKKLVKSTKFFIAVYAVIFLGLIILFTWPLPYIWVVDFFLYIKAIITLILRLLLPVLAVLAVIFVISLLMFTLRRIFTYVRLWFACLKRGVEFNLLRVPFASLRGIRKKGDILIRTPEKDYVIHFADVRHRFSSVFSVVNGREYVMINIGFIKAFSRGDDIRFIGAHRWMKKQIVYSRSNYSLHGKEKKYILPEFDETGKAVHIMMLHARPVDAIKVQGTSKSQLISGDSVGNMTFYYPSDFVKTISKDSK